jgi:hypothetical protein
MKVKNNELLIFDELTNYVEQISKINFDKWLRAMKSKMDFTYINQVWILIDPSKGIKPIVCKCFLKERLT